MIEVIYTWDQGRGVLSVDYNAQNKAITAFIVDNTLSTEVVRIRVVNQENEQVAFDQTWQPGQQESITPPPNVRWNNNSQAKTSNWDIQISSWPPA